MVVVNSGKYTVSLKPDSKTADKTAKINSDGRASCMTALPHTTSSAHQTVTLLSRLVLLKAALLINIIILKKILLLLLFLYSDRRVGACTWVVITC